MAAIRSSSGGVHDPFGAQKHRNQRRSLSILDLRPGGRGRNWYPKLSY